MRYDIPIYARGFKYTRGAIKYAKDIVNGKITASLSIRLECSKFLKELEKEKDKDFPYYFDRLAGERVCAFAETNQHVKGKWASAPLADRFVKLENWQKFLFCSIFGWKLKKNNLRRYREAYIEVPRKNGKSFISAVIGNFMFLCDGEAGAEVYCGATSLDQAEKVFEPAKLMIERNVNLKKKYNVDIKIRSMSLADGSVFKPIVAKPKDGSSPHCSILDEYHQHATDELYQAQATGLGAREQPLILVITTAGKDITSPCHELHDRVFTNQKSEYEFQDQALFGLIYSIDQDDDPYTLDALIKANPNYGVSVSKDYLERQLDNAKKFVNLRSDFLTKNLNVWTSESSAYFDMLGWNNLANADLDIKDYKDNDCFISVDMSAKYDLTVITLVFVRKELDHKHLYVFTNSYLPEDTVEDVTNPNYKRYQVMKQIDCRNTLSGKLLTVIPGAEIDGDFIYTEIHTLISLYSNVREVIFDPWQSKNIMTRLAKAHPRLPVIGMDQNTKNLSPGMKEITGAILSERIHHDGNLILSWCMQNVESKTDKNGNEFPVNSNPKVNKKDAAVTLIMCANRTENCEVKASTSELIKNGGGLRF